MNVAGAGRHDVIVIGAGASGLMCAITAGRRGRSVLILDHSNRAGNKVRVSGGGRCNFTNLHVDSRNYLSNNPHFCKSALTRYRPSDFIALLTKAEIGYTEKEEGQLFCADGSGAILRMLLEECREAGVQIRLSRKIKRIEKGGLFFRVITDSGAIEASSLVVATGGLSYRPLGASDLGYRVAEQFGLHVTPLRPALVPLVFGVTDRESFGELSGVSTEARITCGKKAFEGSILFTHKGLSGPAVLGASLYWKDGQEIEVDLLPGRDILAAFLTLRDSKVQMHNLLAEFMPKRLALALCDRFMQSLPLNRYGTSELKDMASMLHQWRLQPAGTEGYRTAEVTLGGVDTGGLSSKTMEAKEVPGLYFAGEVLDVTGQLGGYNLHWAWASGHAAGDSV